jgi:Outer membrane protein beta-barrel domain
MKKVIAVLFAACLCSAAASAQKVNTFLSFYGGFASAQAKDAKLSAGIGLDCQFNLTSRLHFNLKPTINSRGYNGTLLVSTVKVTYIDLPVNIEADLDGNKVHLYAGAGPYIGFAITGKYKNNLTVSGNTDWIKMKFGETINDNRSPLDYGVNLNIGALIPGYNRDLKAGIQTMFSLKNVVPKDAQSQPNTAAIKLRNISAYIAFGLTKRK